MKRLLTAALWAAPILSLTSGALLAQERQPQGEPLAAPAAVASDPPGLLAPPPERPPERLAARAATEPRPVRIVPIGERDDALPPPVPARWRAEPGGDVLEAPAGGDPFFLSFAAGAHRPPAGERVDPRLIADVQALYTDGRPRQETYAFAMFARRITPERVAELEQLGARVLGFHPHHSLRIALPPHAIDLVAAHPAVRWVGVARPWQKLHPRMPDAPRASDGRVEVYVNVFESDLGGAQTSAPLGELSEGVGALAQAAPEAADQGARVVLSNGWQQRALEALGVDVREYDDAIHAFRARVFPQSLAQLVALDFVQFVEPDVASELHHDESMALVGADRQRTFFNGGTSSSVVGAEVDSGIEISHAGLDSFAWIAADLAGGGATNDGCGHGSHVNGTWMGDGSVSQSYEGVAERLGWGSTGRFKIVKKFTDSCGDGGASMASILSVVHASYTDGGGNVTPRAHVINNSWGSVQTGGWLGTEADARALDADVYTYRQLHVFSAGNDGPGADTLTLHASAKNVLTVGNVTKHETAVGDPGTIWTSSSRGPSGDLRWKPNLSAPGTAVYSADADTASGYSYKTGTSMAAPHVSGVATQVMDRFNFMQYSPAMLSATLMASALTPSDVLHSTEADAHLDSYGAGRVEAFRASGGNGQAAMYFWAYDQGASGWGQFDVDVGAGATRLTVCLVYHEPAASSGAGQALVNDIDLWIDAPPLFFVAGNQGEYSAQQSTRDNVEIRSLDAPAEGTWRMKVYPDSVTSTSRVGLCVIVDYGDTTPSGSLVVSASDGYVKPNEDVSITATASNPQFVASGVFLDSSSSGDSLQASAMTLKDGSVADLLHNPTGGRDVTLGNVVHGESRAATWTTRWGTEGTKSWSVNARSDNWIDRTASVNVVVDGTPPGLVTNLASSDHTPSAWSSDTSITYTWNAAPDNLSGISGYGIQTSQGGPATPAMIQDLGAVTTYTETLASSASGYHFNIRARDRSGNWGGSKSAGPFLIDAVAPGAPGGLQSTTHQVNGTSCDTAISFTWSAAGDAHSGVAGYRYVFDHAPGTSASGGTNLGAGTSGSFNLTTPSSQPWYFHLAARDQAGNVGATVHAGPYFVAEAPAVYCTAKVNSQGCTPQIAFQGTPSVSGGAFQVSSSQLLNGQLGVLFWSTNGPAAIPFQGGTLCVTPPVLRSPLMHSGGNVGPPDCSGALSFTWTGSYLASKGLAAGQTVHCQFWTRDPGSASGTGLTDAVRFTLCD